jgi:hypothetical protein
VTFKDLKKRVSIAEETTTQHQSKIFERLQNKPFWIWDFEQHKREDVKTNGDCCFNHIIDLPIKGRIEKPIFVYEKLLYDSLLGNEYSNIKPQEASISLPYHLIFAMILWPADAA